MGRKRKETNYLGNGTWRLWTKICKSSNERVNSRRKNIMVLNKRILLLIEMNEEGDDGFDENDAE